MSGYTPGPWFPGHYDGPQLFPLGARLVVVTNQPRTLVVAICGHDESDLAAAAKADARLIAAAPDLLAALKAVLSESSIVEADDEGPDGEGWQSDARIALWRAARAAVAKAEGRS